MIILLFGILIAQIFVIIFLVNLKKGIKKEKEKYLEERYLDLNLKYQFLQTTIIIVGIVITFLGWNIKETITSDLKKEVLEKNKKEIEKN